MAFGQKYRVRHYDNHFSILWDARIMFDGYSGAVTDLTYTKNPIVYDMPESDDKFDPIKGSSVRIGFYNLTFEQYTNDFLNASSRQIRLDIYRNGLLWWTGYYVPDALSEEYLSGPNAMYVEFNDGLGGLKDEIFNDIDTVYYGKKTLLEIIFKCLTKTYLDIDLEESCNIYEQNINQTDTDSPLNQIYCDSEGFLDDEEDISCYDVLVRVLIILGARIYQRGGIWHIVPITNFKTSYIYRNFLYDSVSGYTYSHCGTADNYVTISNSSVSLANLNVFLNHSQSRQIDKSLKKLYITKKYGKRDNIIMNGDLQDYNGNSPVNFQPATNYSGEFYNGFYTNGRKTLNWKSKNYFDAYDSLTWIGQFKTLTSVLGLKLSLSFYLSSYIDVDINWALRITGLLGIYYLKSDGTWTTTPIIYNKYTIEKDTKGFDNKTFTIEAIESVPSVGEYAYITLQIFRPKSGISMDIYFNEIKIELTNLFNRFIEEEIIEYPIIDENRNVKEIEINLGDLQLQSYIPIITENAEYIYNKGLYYFTTEYIKTSSWNKKGETDYYSIIDLLCREYASLYNHNTWKLTGEMLGHHDMGSRYIDSDGRIYMIAGLSNFDLKSSRAQITLLEVDQDYTISENWMEWQEGGFVEWEEGGYVEPT